MPQNENNDLTGERLLDEAEILFAQKGFHAVSVREITAAASCNLAAVNYHFGNKKNLYLEVFRRRWVPRAQQIYTCYKDSLADQTNRSPDAIVKSLAKAYLAGPLSDKDRERHHQLIIREMSMPTEASEIVAQATQPLFNDLFNHFKQLMPPNTKEEDLNLKILSIFAMVQYFNFARENIKRITGSEYDREFKTKLIDHIIQFAIEGMGIK